MKKLISLIAILLLVSLSIGCAIAGLPNDPVIEGYFEGITISDAPPITLEGDGRVWVEFRPDLDFETIRGQAGVPTLVSRGVFHGFSLPIWAANNEELYFDICVPGRWDGESDIYMHFDCWVEKQDAANDAFNLQVEWEYYTPDDDIVPATTNPITVETTTGVCGAFQSFQVEFVLPFAGVAEDDIISFRLRRIAVVVGNEADGEVVIEHVGVIFRFDKIGNPTP